jgi:hypothetical protein
MSCFWVVLLAILSIWDFFEAKRNSAMGNAQKKVIHHATIRLGTARNPPPGLTRAEEQRARELYAMFEQERPRIKLLTPKAVLASFAQKQTELCECFPVSITTLFNA